LINGNKKGEKMKKPYGRLMAMALMFASIEGMNYGFNEATTKPKRKIKTWDDLTEKEQQEWIDEYNSRQESIAISKGLSKFTYQNCINIYALNQKNADRKAKKLGLI
jgi:hypothetical protein